MCSILQVFFKPRMTGKTYISVLPKFHIVHALWQEIATIPVVSMVSNDSFMGRIDFQHFSRQFVCFLNITLLAKQKNAI